MTPSRNATKCTSGLLHLNLRVNGSQFVTSVILLRPSSIFIGPPRPLARPTLPWGGLVVLGCVVPATRPPGGSDARAAGEGQ